MKLVARAIIILLCLSSWASAETNASGRNDYLATYIKQLSAMAAISAAVKNMHGTSDCIKVYSDYQVQIESNVRQLEQVHLGGSFEMDTAPLGLFYRGLLGVFQKEGAYCRWIFGEAPDADRAKMLSGISKLNDEQNFLEGSLFKLTPAVFQVLENETVDPRDHTHHLIITRIERDGLVDAINNSFIEANNSNFLDLNVEKPNYWVKSAVILETFLTKKGFKCADE